MLRGKDCKSKKFCGKTLYKSPEVVAKKKKFDPKKNDIWCLGVCLFIMMFGTAPWDIAKSSDASYRWMTNGSMKMKAILIHWGLGEYVDDDLIDLLQGIFQSESKRFTLSQIKNHCWMKSKISS